MQLLGVCYNTAYFSTVLSSSCLQAERLEYIARARFHNLHAQNDARARECQTDESARMSLAFATDYRIHSAPIRVIHIRVVFFISPPKTKAHILVGWFCVEDKKVMISWE